MDTREIVDNDREHQMDWPTTRAAFQARFDALNAQYSASLVTDLDKAIKNYLSTYPTASPADNTVAYQAIMSKINVINTLKTSYQTLNNDIIKLFKNEATNYNLSTILNENGELQGQIQQLKKIQKDTTVDAESAVARDDLLRSRDTSINTHKLFLMDRPIRQSVVPYLWVLSVFCIGVALLFFRDMSPSMAMNSTQTVGQWYEMITSVLLSTNVLLGLLVAAIIAIVFLSLKVSGVLGK
jgi:hypothetical protein